MREISRRSFIGHSAVFLGTVASGAAAASLFLPRAWRAAAQIGRKFVIFARNYQGTFRFEPVGLALRPGDRVTWVNLSDLHTVTAYHPDNGKALRIPEGATSWDSGYFGLGSPELTLTHEFTVPGVYDYFCRPHELLGMVGRLVVGEVNLNRLPSYAQEAGRFPPVKEIVRTKRWLFHWQARLNAPVMASFLEQQAEVEKSASALLEDFRAKADGGGEVGALLRRAGLLAGFEQDLRELATAASVGGSYEEILARTDALKGRLTQAAGDL